MNTLTKNTQQKELISILAIFIYRTIERVDGEKGFKLVPYKISQIIKMKVLIYVI